MGGGKKMGDFKDFDLDLRNVKANRSASSVSSSLFCEAVKMTLKQKCNSVETPTTGMTGACCAKSSAAEPMCI